jgi:hypothetical protein
MADTTDPAVIDPTLAALLYSQPVPGLAPGSKQAVLRRAKLGTAAMNDLPAGFVLDNQPAPQGPQIMPQAAQPIPPQRTPNLTAATQPPQQPLLSDADMGLAPHQGMRWKPAAVPGMFDDLIPQNNKTAAAPPPGFILDQPAPGTMADPWAAFPIANSGVQPNAAGADWSAFPAVSQQTAPPTPRPTPQGGMFDDLIPKQQDVSTTADVAKSFGVGGAEGLIGLAGAPGDITSLVTGGKYGGGFGSEAIQRAVEGYTGEFYKPQTTLGRYGETFGKFAGAAALPAGELSIGARLLKMTLLPAIASETAGQLTQGTAAEPYARLGTAALTGGLAGMSKKAPAAIVPSVADTKSAASGLYDAVTQAANGIAMPQAERDALAAAATNRLNNMALRPSNPAAKPVHDAIAEISDPKFGDLSDLIGARQNIKNLRYGNNVEPQTVLAANNVIPIIDTQILRFGGQPLFNSLKDADANYARAMTAQDIENAIAKGGCRAAKSGTGGNVDNALRQEIDKAAGDLSLAPEEQAQLDRTVLGDRLTNTARYVGKLDPTSGGLSAMLHLMSTIPTGGANIPFAAAGFGARKLAEARTMANARQLSQMILSRSPLAQSMPLPPLPQLGLSPMRRALVNAALSFGGDRSNQQFREVPLGGR